MSGVEAAGGNNKHGCMWGSLCGVCHGAPRLRFAASATGVGPPTAPCGARREQTFLTFPHAHASGRRGQRGAEGCVGSHARKGETRGATAHKAAAASLRGRVRTPGRGRRRQQQALAARTGAKRGGAKVVAGWAPRCTAHNMQVGSGERVRRERRRERRRTRPRGRLATRVAPPSPLPGGATSMAPCEAVCAACVMAHLGCASLAAPWASVASLRLAVLGCPSAVVRRLAAKGGLRSPDPAGRVVELRPKSRASSLAACGFFWQGAHPAKLSQSTGISSPNPSPSAVGVCRRVD